MRLSGLTIVFGAYIVVSAAFMLQVNLWLTSKVGNPFLFRSFWVAALIALAAALVHGFRSRPGIKGIFAVLVIFALAYFLGTRQRYFEEKTHILMYGLLGYLAARDLISAGVIARLRGATAAGGFVILVSACDEVFQGILPYRFGEWGDFITNILGGFLGICLYYAVRKKEAI